jgi:hypothetical protein
VLPGIPRPVVRIGRTLIYPDGTVRRMGLIEYAQLKLGAKTTVRVKR